MSVADRAGNDCTTSRSISSCRIAPGRQTFGIRCGVRHCVTTDRSQICRRPLQRFKHGSRETKEGGIAGAQMQASGTEPDARSRRTVLWFFCALPTTQFPQVFNQYYFTWHTSIGNRSDDEITISSDTGVDWSIHVDRRIQNRIVESIE